MYIPEEMTAKYSATGAPPPIKPADPAEKARIEKANLTALEKAQEDLKTKLATEPEALKIVEDEINLTKGPLDPLDPSSSEKLPDGSKNLEEYQNKQRVAFEKSIKNKDKAKDLLADLDAMFTMQRDLLQKETQTRLKSGYDAFMDKHFPEAKERIAAADPTAPPSSLLDVLRKMPKSELRNAKGNYIRIKTENTLESNNPELLGESMARAGYKEITVTGDPENVIRTAEAALKNGVLSVKFDKNMRKKILNPRMYNSDPEFLSMKARLEAIDEISTANSYARNSNNTVFNETKNLSEKTDTFNHVSEEGRGHALMIAGMSAKEAAKLAFDNKGVAYTKPSTLLGMLPNALPLPKGIPLNGHDYVKSFLSPGAVAGFDQEYANLVTAESLKDARIQTNDPKAVAEFIRTHKEDLVRHKLYDKITELKPKPEATDSEKKDFQHEVRVHLLTAIMKDKKNKPTAYNLFGMSNYDMKEIKAVIGKGKDEVDKAERDKILRIYNKNPDIETLDPSGEVEKYVKSLLTPAEADKFDQDYANLVTAEILNDAKIKTNDHKAVAGFILTHKEALVRHKLYDRITELKPVPKATDSESKGFQHEVRAHLLTAIMQDKINKPTAYTGKEIKAVLDKVDKAERDKILRIYNKNPDIETVDPSGEVEKYIKSLLTPAESDKFDKEYLMSLNNPAVVTNFICSHKEDRVRHKFYNLINELKSPEDTELKNKEFQHEVRARLLADIMTDKKDPGMSNYVTKEIKAILDKDKTDKADRVNILQLYKEAAGITTNLESSGDQVYKIISEMDPTVSEKDSTFPKKNMSWMTKDENSEKAFKRKEEQAPPDTTNPFFNNK